MFSDEEVTVTESDGKVDLTIIKSGTNSRDVLVTYTTLDGNAIGIIITHEPPQNPSCMCYQPLTKEGVSLTREIT